MLQLSVWMEWAVTWLQDAWQKQEKLIQMDVSKKESVQKAFEFVTNYLPTESGRFHKPQLRRNFLGD